MDAKEIQKTFLQRVKASLPAHVAFVDELAELLNTSNDSAYRRIRAETLLSIDEIALICAHFKVPFETANHASSETVTFNYTRLDGKEENFNKWLHKICNDVKRIESVTGSSVLYAADDVPIWHHFFNDKLTAFKLFYWLKSIVGDEYYADKKFNPKWIKPDLLAAGKQLLENYNRIPSAEIWSDDTLNSTLKQVEYFWESGYFENKEQAWEICDCITEEINLLQIRAARESKLESGEMNFKLYHSEVMIGNNSILVYLGGSKIAYVSNNTFNMMSTNTPDFVAENERWLQNLIRKSILISGVSEKQRNRFFSILHSKIEALKQSIR